LPTKGLAAGAERLQRTRPEITIVKEREKTVTDQAVSAIAHPCTDTEYVGRSTLGITTWLKILGAYAVVHGLIIAVIYLYPGTAPVATRFRAFDASYYAYIASHGYPTSLPLTGGSPIAFLPGYPLVVRGADELFHLPVWLGLVVVSVVFGAIATVVVTLVACESSHSRDDWTTGLWWQLLPMSFLFCIGYSEALFVSAAGLALLLCMRRRWVLAGVAAAVSATVLASGIVFVAVGVVAALAPPPGHRRTLRPLAISVIAPLGLLAYFIYLWRHVGSFFAWKTAEQRGWQIHEDFGIAAIKFAGHAILYPAQHPWFDIVTLSMLGVLTLLVLAIRQHVPWVAIVYVVGILFLATTSGVATLSSFPRVAFTAFPLFIPLARFVSRLPVAVQVVLALAGVTLGGTLAIVVTVGHLVTP